ncbi:Zn-dependent protease (includes SpoIVFB) [Rhizobium sp. NFR07]|uniref:site-2 protease family protein n=1 Tax=Rhizobium sp. NFR07 TaxID=1566262 RepID=UPI0008E4775A|nr:site-2 protease family protein [Rhizobium sp. NFR07]SFB11163.1 Zn-dependent protease (includes SpoIVFB) [Rhizobium sp. NFR07]
MKFKLQDDGLAIDILRLPRIFVHGDFALIVFILSFFFIFGAKLSVAWLGAAVVVAAGIVLSILAHELGHALTARRLGFYPLLIRLHGGGGEAVWEGRPATRRELQLITLAGPVVNFAIAGILLGACLLLKPEPPTFDPEMLRFSRPPPLIAAPILQALEWLGWMNVVWAIGNLLPAYPLDGGRILNEFLEPWIGYYRTLFWIGLSGAILAVIAKVVFVIGLLVGVFFWAPLSVRLNWSALQAGRAAFARSRRGRS